MKKNLNNTTETTTTTATATATATTTNSITAKETKKMKKNTTTTAKETKMKVKRTVPEETKMLNALMKGLRKEGLNFCKSIKHIQDKDDIFNQMTAIFSEAVKKILELKTTVEFEAKIALLTDEQKKHLAEILAKAN
jgi:hypothetical protein